MDKYMIAAVFGPTLIIIGLSLIVAIFKDEIGEEVWCENRSAANIHGFICLVFGIAIIHTYNIWMWDMALFVTLLGWLLALEGVWVLFFPKGFVKTWFSSRGVTFVSGIIGIIWGIALLVFAHH